MALSPKAQRKIRDVVRQYVNYMRYRSVGPHALTKKELTELVRAGWITSKKPTATAVAEAYLKTHQLASNGQPAPQNIRDGAINFLERMFNMYSGKMGQQLQVDLAGTIEGSLASLFNRREGKAIYDTLKDKDKYKKNIQQQLKGKIDSYEARWRTIVNTELNRASNWGSMDAILNNNPQKSPKDIFVYKIGPLDGATCDYCKQFWFHNGSPKVYRLSELMANGSNIGRKQKDWLPTVDSTHPNERHILHEIKDGWGFDGLELGYVDRDHSEFHHQRGLKKSEDLAKIEKPRFAGESTDQYEATSHRGQLVWRNKEAVRNAHEATVDKYKNFFVQANFKPEHHALVHDFINHVMTDPHRHLIPSMERDPKPGDLGHSVRARHVRSLVSSPANGKGLVYVQPSAKHPDYLGIKIIRHGEEAPEGHKIVDTFAYKRGHGLTHLRREAVPKESL